MFLRLVNKKKFTITELSLYIISHEKVYVGYFKEGKKIIVICIQIFLLVNGNLSLNRNMFRMLMTSKIGGVDQIVKLCVHSTKGV